MNFSIFLPFYCGDFLCIKIGVIVRQHNNIGFMEVTVLMNKCISSNSAKLMRNATLI